MTSTMSPMTTSSVSDEDLERCRAVQKRNTCRSDMNVEIELKRVN
jgi:hypothetical protein